MATTTSRETVKIGDVVEGRYRILKALGEGGMGTVFLAEHTLIKRRVAIKILHPELATDADVIERFMNEARAAGTLGHPNIVESTDMGFMDGHVPYIVFEYLEGTLLTDEIYRVGGLPVRRAVRIAQQIASALSAAHAASIVHRDLKSDNVFLTDKDDALDHVKVIDFGISRFLETDDEQTRRGMVMGTPEFMAPEQITDPQSVDRRADIYALGVMLYEMLEARRPFSAEDDPRALMQRIVHTAPPPLTRAEVPHAMAEMIMQRLLAKDPAERYATMLDVEAALDAFVTTADAGRKSRAIPVVDARRSDLIARPAGVVETWPPRAADTIGLPTAPVRRPWALYGVAALGVALGAGGLLFGLRGKDAPTAPLAATPAPRETAPQKIAVRLAANVPDARVTFRRRVAAAPSTLQIAASDIVELVEVSAPGHKTARYWLTFDRPTTLTAQLVAGDGTVEATEEETLIALGELAAPPVAAAQPVAVAVAQPTVAPVDAGVVLVAARRSVGRAAASRTVARAPVDAAVVAAVPTESAEPSVAAASAEPSAVDPSVAAPSADPSVASPSAESPSVAAPSAAESGSSAMVVGASGASPSGSETPSEAASAPTASATGAPGTNAHGAPSESGAPSAVPSATGGEPAPSAAAMAPPSGAPASAASDSADAAAPPSAAAITAAPPHVETPRAKGLDAATLSSMIGRHRPEVFACYSAGKKQNAKLAGTLTLQLLVEPSGKVRAQVQSTLGSPQVAACVIKAASRWKFPAHDAGAAQPVSYPFTFR